MRIVLIVPFTFLGSKYSQENWRLQERCGGQEEPPGMTCEVKMHSNEII